MLCLPSAATFRLVHCAGEYTDSGDASFLDYEYGHTMYEGIYNG